MDALREGRVSPPVCIATNMQSAGIGSRGASWLGTEGNLFFSFALGKEMLPSDLPLQSASIYFGFIFKEILEKKGSKLFLKWPNDLYLKSAKIGGVLTTSQGGALICGIGLNTYGRSLDFGVLDIEIEDKSLLEAFFLELEKKRAWKHIFSKYEIEFYKQKEIYIKQLNVDLSRCTLADDGSVLLDGERFFGNR